MKKHILCLVIGLFPLIISVAHAQNTLAKLKYEDAEEAYIAKDYPLALTKLAEVEVLLKATNPKLMYLKISVQAKMVQDPASKDFALLDNTRKLTALYLKNYESVPDNEDKYRDVYKISEALNKYPATEETFMARFNKPQLFLDSLCLEYKFKTGLTKMQFGAYNAEAQVLFYEQPVVSDNKPGEMMYTTTEGKKQGPYSIKLTNGIVTEYVYTILKGNDATEVETALAEYKNKIKLFSDATIVERSNIIGFRPIKSTIALVVFYGANNTLRLRLYEVPKN